MVYLALSPVDHMTPIWFINCMFLGIAVAMTTYKN
jgi:hypothetical protein